MDHRACLGNMPHVDEITLEKLEFDDVRDLLAGQCACALGRRLARSLDPTSKPGLIREWMDQVVEMISASEAHGLPPMAGIHDIRGYVRASSGATPLEPEALADIGETLGATRSVMDWLLRVEECAPSLYATGSRMIDLCPLADTINESIDARGVVRDYASPKLASIRRTIEDAKRRVRDVFDRIVKKSGVNKMLQYSNATFHNDRMVLPLKAEYRGRIPGIVHRSSDSGATLFVEPSESVELNNAIVRLAEEEFKEVTRILRELTGEVRIRAEEIMTTLRVVGVLDLVAAKVRYAKRWSCVVPQIDIDGVMNLFEARHPLLLELFAKQSADGDEAREVVPIDVRLGEDFDVLVITGPNTGGKTVTLKTVGLLAVMTQCGIPIPAGEGTRMPVYRDIFIDIGDEQSLQQSLSTFSSHLANQLRILQRSGQGCLVLVDELGAGTDPDEGAAIGRAIITELLGLAAKAIVTTHLSALKTVAFSSARVDNAAVEFDAASLRPTFRVHLGEPGNSNALIIAQRLGMPLRLVKEAQKHLEDRTRALNKAIAGTLQSRRQAEKARKQARDAVVEAERERENLQRNRAELEASQEAFERWAKWVNQLDRGDKVWIKALRRPGTVVRMQLHKQTAVVSSGAMDLELPLRDIDFPEEGGQVS